MSRRRSTPLWRTLALTALLVASACSRTPRTDDRVRRVATPPTVSSTPASPDRPVGRIVPSRGVAADRTRASGLRTATRDSKRQQHEQTTEDVDADATPVSFVDADTNGFGGVDGLDGVLGVTVSPDGQHVYATGSLDHKIAVFTRNTSTGALTFVDADTNGFDNVTGLGGPAGLAVSADGAHVYVAAADSSAVVVFSRNSTTGHP